MSTEKVNQYKEKKRRRKEIAKKEKWAKVLQIILCVVVLGAVGIWCAYLGHGVYQKSHSTNSGNRDNSVISASNAVVTDSAGNEYNLVQTSSGGYQLMPKADSATNVDQNTEENSNERSIKENNQKKRKKT